MLVSTKKDGEEIPQTQNHDENAGLHGVKPTSTVKFCGIEWNTMDI